MKSTSKTTTDRYQPYNFRTRATRVNYTPWFANPHRISGDGIKPTRTVKPGRGRGKKGAPQLDHEDSSKHPGPNPDRTEESSSGNRFPLSSPVAQTNSLGAGHRSVQGMIACALLEVCPNLQELDDVIPELLACLNSAWASDRAKFSLPVGTAVEELQEILQVDLAVFTKAIREAVDEIISLLEYALRVLEKCNKTDRIDHAGSGDMMWSNSKTEEFQARSGSRITTLGKAMRSIRHEIVQLLRDVAGQLEAVEEMSRATNTIKISLNRTSGLIPMAVSENAAILRILSKQCERAENKLDHAVKALHTFQGKLRQLVKGEGHLVDVKHIDADSIRPRVEKMKAMREEAEEESFIMGALLKPSGM
ncbi:hypothetical protein V5O48_003337 [Marasmius crinis-equi]|uniref:Uncharacterized protein n=1 Tax=Marasmius crinis-equi TaxID=585013 RepID=A0ABR3FT72_9AGAR